MTDEICEKARVYAMALADGHSPELNVGEIETHLAGCDDCRADVERIRAVMRLLDAQKRRELPVNLWERIERRLEETRPPSWPRRHGFLIATLLLLGYKVIELAAAPNLGLVFKIVPVLIAVAAFAYLKENPFKINMELDAQERVTS